MSHNLSLAQSHAFDLARTLMIHEFGVLPSDEIDGDEVEIIYEYDPYEGRSAH